MEFVNLDVTTTPRVANVEMNRPEKLNSLTLEMLTELGQCFRQLANRGDIQVAVLCGSGRAFAAGVDLKSLKVTRESLERGDIGPQMNTAARELIQLIEEAPFPVIAKIQGACFTGALELALACDWIVTADNTKFGDTHAKLGIRPTWGMTVRLSEAVGLRRARELSHTGRVFSGAEAKEYGLATIAVPADQLDQTVAKQCSDLLQNSQSSLTAYKTLYRQENGANRHAALENEANSRFECLDAPDRVEEFLASIGRR